MLAKKLAINDVLNNLPPLVNMIRRPFLNKLPQMREAVGGKGRECLSFMIEIDCDISKCS